VIGTGCGKKTEPATGSAGSAGSAAVAAGPATCPGGSVVKDGACVAVITADKVAAVVAQKTRLDDLATFLDKVDALAAPIELLNGVRQTPQWKSISATSSKLAVVDQVVVVLDDGVKMLRTFKASLGDAATKLSHLSTTLDGLMKDTGAAKQLADVRAQISTELRGVVEPLAAQVQDTITKAIAPIEAQLSDTADLVIGACAMAKLSGGDDLKKLCGRAKDVFAQATAYITELKAKPAALFDDVSKQLETQLDQLVDTETHTLILAAQAKVDDALKLPAQTGSAGSGSAH
jgi:hypothetical protein